MNPMHDKMQVSHNFVVKQVFLAMENETMN